MKEDWTEANPQLDPSLDPRIAERWVQEMRERHQAVDYYTPYTRGENMYRELVLGEFRKEVEGQWLSTGDVQSVIAIDHAEVRRVTMTGLTQQLGASQLRMTHEKEKEEQTLLGACMKALQELNMVPHGVREVPSTPRKTTTVYTWEGVFVSRRAYNKKKKRYILRDCRVRNKYARDLKLAGRPPNSQRTLSGLFPFVPPWEKTGEVSYRPFNFPIEITEGLDDVF